MLLLAKSVLALALGFVLAIIIGLIAIPILKRLKVGQVVSRTINILHLKKEGTPTMGGVIFIIPTLLAIAMLIIKGSVPITANLLIILFVFVSYGLLGFADDFLKVTKKNNGGLSIIQKLIAQIIIAGVFFFIYTKYDGTTVLEVSAFGIKADLGWFYYVFILVMLLGTTNAVNITDGLDGLCGGLSIEAFLAYGLICWNSTYITGYSGLAIFCFVLVGSIMGFLLFNSHPAKVFMGDTGALALGGALATVAILSHHEISLALIGGVFVIEIVTDALQIFLIRKFKKRIFLKAPIHHHFEELGWEETDIVKSFWVVGFLLAIFGIVYGVWL